MAAANSPGVRILKVFPCSLFVMDSMTSGNSPPPMESLDAADRHGAHRSASWAVSLGRDGELAGTAHRRSPESDRTGSSSKDFGSRIDVMRGWAEKDNRIGSLLVFELILHQAGEKGKMAGCVLQDVVFDGSEFQLIHRLPDFCQVHRGESIVREDLLLLIEIEYHEANGRGW